MFNKNKLPKAVKREIIANFINKTKILTVFPLGSSRKVYSWGSHNIPARTRYNPLRRGTPPCTHTDRSRPRNYRYTFKMMTVI